MDDAYNSIWYLDKWTTLRDSCVYLIKIVPINLISIKTLNLKISLFWTSMNSLQSQYWIIQSTETMYTASGWHEFRQCGQRWCASVAGCTRSGMGRNAVVWANTGALPRMEGNRWCGVAARPSTGKGLEFLFPFFVSPFNTKIMQAVVILPHGRQENMRTLLPEAGISGRDK